MITESIIISAESLDQEIKDVSKKIILLAKENKMAKLLTTIPGIGHYSALFLVSEIDDINRFPDSYHLCSYAGLVPSTHSSGGVTYHGNDLQRIRQMGIDHIFGYNLIPIGRDVDKMIDITKQLSRFAR